MNRDKLRRLIGLTVPVLALTASASHAGGILLWEIGTPTLGTASAGWAAMPEDAATAFTNPAGTVWRDETDIRVAGQLLYGDVGFSDGGLTNVEGGDGGNPLEWFPGAGTFVAGKLNDRIGWGFAATGNFGLGLDYDDDWSGRRFVQDVDLLSMSLVPSVSWQANPCLSFGLGLNVVAGYFKYESAPRAGLIPGDARLKYGGDVDFSYGANLGMMYRPVEGTTFGLTYTSEVDLDFSSRLELRNFGPLYEALVGRLDGARTKIDTRIPATLTASWQQQLQDNTTFYANVGWQDWSEFSYFGLEIADPAQVSVTVDRGYKDTGHVAFGVRHQFTRGWLTDWTLSSGIAFDNSAVAEANLTADLITDKAYRLGLGARREICPEVTLDVGYTLVWLGDVDIDQEGGAIFNPRLQGTYKDTALHFFGASVQFGL